MKPTEILNGNWREGEAGGSIVTGEPTDDPSDQFYGGKVICETVDCIAAPLILKSPELLRLGEKVLDWFGMSRDDYQAKYDENIMEAIINPDDELRQLIESIKRQSLGDPGEAEKLCQTETPT